MKEHDSNMRVENYRSKHATDIADLFYASVHSIDNKFYSTEQKQVWAPKPIDYHTWAKRLDIKRPFIAFIDDQIVGFIELDPDGHIDCCYTHPDYQNKGVATTLYQHLVTEAEKRGMKRLYVEASLLARPFFEKQGFRLIKENQVERAGLTLQNYSLEKKLNTQTPIA